MRASSFAAATALAVLAGDALAQERTMTPSPAFEKLLEATAQPAAPKAARGQPIAAAYDALLRGDYAKARSIAEPLAARKDPAADHLLGYLYEKGLGVRADIGAALRHYGDAAIAGSADAQVALGVLAIEGGGVWPDYERAAGWFRLASAQGDSRADVRLGLMYMEGVGVAQDAVAAAHHFARAADRGDPDGAFYLGFAFLNGDGVAQSYAKAAARFSAAAAKGHGEAAYHLALIAEAGVLGAPDAAKAARLMRAAAEAGYPPAFAAMGLIVHRGDAPGLAADWFEKGAEAGDPQAAFLYAVALSEGDGRAKDIGAAIALIDSLIAAPDVSPPLKAQARTLRKAISQRTNGPLKLRN